jgi:sortase A
VSGLVERALLVIGLSCLGWYGLAAADAAFTQRESRARIERLLEEGQAAPGVDAAVPSPAVPTEGGAALGTSLVGLLEIPRLGVSTPVVEGDDTVALRGAAGHLPDTPRPGEAGNSAIAAHRDGIFRPLRQIRVGDELRVQTPRGEFQYRVKDTRIVLPADLSVLRQTRAQTLTLITCYPFNDIGAAPKRFIVHAERIDR